MNCTIYFGRGLGEGGVITPKHTLWMPYFFSVVLYKMYFLFQYPAIPGSLKLSDEELDEIVGRDINCQ
jgi:hypothetical protein